MPTPSRHASIRLLLDTQWTLRDITDANQVRMAEMLKDGMSVRDIADEIGVSKSTVHRFKAKIDASN